MPIIDLVPQETVNRVAAWLLQLADQYKTQLQFKMVPAPFMPPAPSSRSWKASDASVEEVMRILERIHIALSFEYHDWGEDGTPELTAPELVKCCAYVVDYVRDRTRSPDAVEWLRHISGKMHDAHKLWGEETMAGDFAPDAEKSLSKSRAEGKPVWPRGPGRDADLRSQGPAQSRHASFRSREICQGGA
jgi:hypothetical protein